MHFKMMLSYILTDNFNQAGVQAGKYLRLYWLAELLYRWALKRNPSYASAHYNRACNFARWRKVKQVRVSLGKAFELNLDRYHLKASNDDAFDSCREVVGELYQAVTNGPATV